MKLRTAALLSALSSGALMVPSGWAVAQERADQGGGTALDANRQAGGSRVNPASQQPDYRARNDLVTGNVAGGQGFRDEVGYTTEGAFRGQTGSSDLFRFQADSFNSNPYRPRQNYSGPLSSSPTPVFNTFTDPTGYRANTVGGTLDRFNSRNLVRPELDASTGLISLPSPERRVSDNLVGLVPGRDGQQTEFTASPLLGLRADTFVSNLEAPRDDSDQGQSFDEADAQRERDFGQQRRLDLSTGRSNRLDLNAGPSPEGTDGEGASESDNSDPMDFNPRSDGRVAPTLVLGAQLQDVLRRELQDSPRGVEQPEAGDGQAEDTAAVKRQQRAADLARDEIFKPLEFADEQAVEEDPFLRLLREISAEKAQGEAGGPEAREDWMGAIQSPDAREARNAEVEAAKALRASMGLQEAGRDDPSLRPELSPDNPLGALLNDLNYDLPRLESFAGQRQERVNETLKQAEAQLAAGKYFDAESSFQQVLTDAPNKPLARTGLIHSQLGGGMIRSAAFNMRQLFADHPELIAMKYDARLLPPAKRLTWLQGQLQQMIGRGDHTGEPGIMLAYLGYQTNTPLLVSFGLDVAQARAPRDELVPVLRRIWLDRDDANPLRGQDDAPAGGDEQGPDAPATPDDAIK